LIPSLLDANAVVSRVALGMLASVSILACVAILFADHSGNSPVDNSRTAVAVVALLGSVIAYIFGTRGRLRLGLGLALGSIFSAATAHAILSGYGIHAYLVGSFCLIIIACYLLISRLAGHVATAIGFTTLISLFAAEMAGLIGGNYHWPIPARNVFLVYCTMYAIAAVTGYRYSDYFAALLDELAKQSQQFRTAFLALPMGCMISRDGTILLANEIYLGQSGIDRNQTLTGVSLLDLAGPEYRERVAERIAQGMRLPEGGQLPVERFSIRHADKMRTYETTTRRIRLADGPALLTVATDVTEHNAALGELGVERERAVAANQAKGTFLAMMSHEIRTPLNAVIGLTEIMRHEKLDEATQKRFLSLVAESSNTLLQLLNNALDMSRAASGKLVLEHEPIDLRALCEAIGHTYATLVETRNIEFRVAIEPNVPAYILADSLRLKQVIGNLVSNAIKFTSAGFVVLRARASKAEIVIEVEDSGIGIRKEDQAKLFATFSQANSATTREYGGSGLGLALCRELVQLMGGTISATSDPGKGSIFTLSIPAMLPEETADTRTVEPADPPTPAMHGTVLVVEDNEVNSLVVKAMLALAGASPVTCTNGAAALAHCAKGAPDLVLLDLNMPEMDGFECAKRLRELAGMQKVPIIAFTAMPIDLEDPRIGGAGIDDVLNKPVTKQALSAMLVRWMDRNKG
jgi:PAS domain S-box-containing protein